MNFLATFFNVNESYKAKKWLYFVNLSTTTKMVSMLAVFGNSNMKSIETSSHTLVGIGKSCNNIVEK